MIAKVQSSLTINILWVVNCQIHFPQSQSLSCSIVVCQENALRCDRLLATSGKAERTVCVMEVGVQSHKQRKYRERLELTCQSAWDSHHESFMDFSELEGVRNLLAPS